MITVECGDAGVSMREERVESMLFRENQRRGAVTTCLDAALEAAVMGSAFSHNVKENEYSVFLSALAFLVYTMTLEPFPDVDTLAAARELINVVEQDDSFTISCDPL